MGVQFPAYRNLRSDGSDELSGSELILADGQVADVAA